VLVTDDGAIAGFDPKFTVAPLTKPEPLTVSVKAAPPAVALVGESDVMIRFGLLMVNGMLAEVPPPGAGFVTVTFAVPAVVMSAAVIPAVSCVELINVVVLATPLNFTTDVDMKLVPFTVNVRAAPPAVALGGAIEISVGAGLVTVNTCAFDIPPAGTGFVTVTFTVPAVVMSPAGIVATICVLVTDEGVIAGLDPKFTVAPLAKPVPVRVNVNAAPPTVVLAGAIEVSVRADPLIVNDRVPDVPPPGTAFVTVTLAVPAVAISAAVIAAVNCVALTNVVVLAAPLNFTTDVDTNPVPFTVRVKAAPPAVAFVGEIEVSVGAGLLMVKV